MISYDLHPEAEMTYAAFIRESGAVGGYSLSIALHVHLLDVRWETHKSLCICVAMEGSNKCI
jgi:hypothetical protein